MNFRVIEDPIRVVRSGVNLSPANTLGGPRRPARCGPQPQGVLLVEPDSVLSGRLSAVLSAAGLKVERVTDAGAAYERLRRSPAGLVVSNVRLPDESGWLLAAKLRLSSPRPRVWLHSVDRQPWEVPFAAFIGAERLIRDRDELRPLVVRVAATEESEAAADGPDAPSRTPGQF